MKISFLYLLNSLLTNSLQSSESQFFDFKFWVMLLALIVSGISLYKTITNQKEQNRRWDALNLANVVLTEVKLMPWRKLTRERALSINWQGFEPGLYGIGEGTEEYGQISVLVAMELGTNNRLNGFNYVYEIGDIEPEAIRIGANPRSFDIVQLVKIRFSFENIGKTTANRVTYEIFSKDLENNWFSIFRSNGPINIPSSAKAGFDLEKIFDVNPGLPERIHFKIQMDCFSTDGEALVYKTIVVWSRNTNLWEYGAIE